MVAAGEVISSLNLVLRNYSHASKVVGSARTKRDGGRRNGLSMLWRETESWGELEMN